MQQGGVWGRPGLPGHGEPLPRRVLHLCGLQYVCVCVCVCVWRGGGPRVRNRRTEEGRRRKSILPGDTWPVSLRGPVGRQDSVL